MATRTAVWVRPIRLLLLLLLDGVNGRVGRVRGVRGARLFGMALGVDQLVQPTHLALDRLEPVALQFEGVAVQPLAGAPKGGPYAFQPFLQPVTTAFEDPHPRLR